MRKHIILVNSIETVGRHKTKADPTHQKIRRSNRLEYVVLFYDTVFCTPEYFFST